MALIRDTARRLDSPWVSEHLSVAGTPHRQAGFLLPPLQTEAGVETAAANIAAFKAGIAGRQCMSRALASPAAARPLVAAQTTASV